MNKPVVIITGASSGIGAATAVRLAREGFRLTLAARRADRLGNVAAEAERLGAEILVVQADVCIREDIQRMAQATLDRWGRIDVLINNAGIGSDKPLMEFASEEIRAKIQTNLIAPVDCVQAVLPAMLRQGSGHIINVSSIAGLIALPGSSIYCASKFGLVGFNDSLRRELRGTGVYVSAFCPGFTPSEINPVLRAHAEGRPNAPRVIGLMKVEYVADQLARLIHRPRRKVILPKSWSVLVLLAFLSPPLADWIIDKINI